MDNLKLLPSIIPFSQNKSKMNGQNPDKLNPEIITTNSVNRKVTMISLVTVFIIALAAVSFFLFKKGLFKTQNNQSTKKFVANPQLQKGPFICPAPADFCKFSGKLASASANLAKGTNLFAVFDGQVKILPQSNKTLTTLSLQDDQRGLRANYYLAGGQITKSTTVKAGDILATIDGQLLPAPYLRDKTFQFVLFNRLTEEGWKTAILSASDFK